MTTNKHSNASCSFLWGEVVAVTECESTRTSRCTVILRNGVFLTIEKPYKTIMGYWDEYCTEKLKREKDSS